MRDTNFPSGQWLKLATAFVALAALSLAAEEPKLPVDDPLANNPLFDVPPVDKLPPLANPTAQAPVFSPATSVTLNLLKIMVAKRLLTEEEAQGLIAQAQAEAEQAKAAQLEDASFPGSPDDVRVTYIPENVKQQMREDIKHDVLEQAKAEKWAAALPRTNAEWTERIKWFGDVRFRFRSDLLDDQGNDNTGAFPNFNAINTGAPFDTSGTQFSPQFNVDQDRNRFQLRARLGLEASLEDGWSVGVGFGTGESNTPVTQNQGLGLANQGQGGNFSKYGLWLDRAFIRYEAGSELGDNVNILLGRYNNPFFSTEMMWDDDLGFDGIAVKGQKKLGDDVSVFGTAGMFPIFNTDFNFATNQPAKFKSTDKYLYGAQFGVNFKIADKVTAKLAAAYYAFQDIEGRLSTPYIPLTPQDAGDTDNTRPSFAQRGNTYRPLRAIIPSVNNGFGTLFQYQYYGLASKFTDLNITGRIDIDIWEPYRLSFIGDFVKNTAWN
ncbi:MAG: putative porin, partial [Prosthecobacter sp.]|nr:putative porin [Prosthecobacter sp.]